MTTYLRARDVTLELPQQLQGDNDFAGGSLGATLKATHYRYSTVLSRISFEAVEGDRIGILGLNGAGKTTLLRVLNGGLPPTSGTVDRKGNLQSLLNPMLGFNEQASLAENVLLRATAMGLRYRQIQPRMNDILAFAGLEDRASHRLHLLSAGQRLRLGFAISTAVQPDILVMDEWLSAGDAAFIERAQARMRDRFQGSRIVVLATHSTGLLRAMCNKALVMHNGRMRFFGSVDEGIADYRAVVSKASAEMRGQIADMDPMLFGDCPGVVERIRTTGPLVEVQGWAVADKGGEVGTVCVDLGGKRHFFEEFERIDRDDVRAHLGRSRGRFGFKVVVNRGRIDAAETVVHEARVSVGKSASDLGAPLPLAKAAIVEVA